MLLASNVVLACIATGELIAVCLWLLTRRCQRGYTLTFAFSLLEVGPI
jgi:hypothetical protein